MAAADMLLTFVNNTEMVPPVVAAVFCLTKKDLSRLFSANGYLPKEDDKSEPAVKVAPSAMVGYQRPKVVPDLKPPEVKVSPPLVVALIPKINGATLAVICPRVMVKVPLTVPP